MLFEGAILKGLIADGEFYELPRDTFSPSTCEAWRLFLFQGGEIGEDVFDFLGLKDKAHGGHGGDGKWVAFGDLGIGIEDGCADVVGVLAGGDAIESGSDDAAFSADDVATRTGGDFVVEEEVLAADGIGYAEFFLLCFLRDGNEFGETDIFIECATGRLSPSAVEGIETELLVVLGIEINGDVGPVVFTLERLGVDAWILDFVDVQNGSEAAAFDPQCFDLCAEAVAGIGLDFDVGDPRGVGEFFRANFKDVVF